MPFMFSEEDTAYMQAALAEAKKAAASDEVPIGAVLVEVATGDIVARASNSTRRDADPTHHAEIRVIREVCKKAGAQRIPEHDLYVTLEPCPMCAAAISYARIRRVIFAACDPKSGGVLHGPKLYEHGCMHHKPEVQSGLCGEEAGVLLKEFFQTKREEK